MEIEIDISKVLKGLDLASKAIEEGFRKGVEKSAVYLEAKMVDKINSNIAPPLKEATIKRKGSSLALVDTGELIGQITSEIDGCEAKVGVIGSRAEIATYHEFGAPAAGIPERSFLRTSLSENKSTINQIINVEISKNIK